MKEYSRLLKLPTESSCFLFGPRGVGKSHYIRKHYPDALYINLLKPEIFTELSAAPERLRHYIDFDKHDLVIINEVQKVPLLLDEVHRMIEENGIRFILTGSSARKLKKVGVNLLAGRATTCKMYPLCASELGDDFELGYSLKYGQLPLSYQRSSPEKYLRSYIHTYLKEEVLQEGLSRNLGGFARFLEIATFSQGEVVNLSEIGRECHLSYKVVENYFSILEDLLIATRLPVFTKRAKRKMTHHPKFYYFDVGVFRHIRPKGPLDSLEELEGSALETLVCQELCALNEYHDWFYDLYYWRTSGQQEVDFVLYGERGLHAIEVKRKSVITSKDLKSMKLFLEDYPMAKAYVFYGGEQTYYQGDIQIIPMDTALAKLEQMF